MPVLAMSSGKVTAIWGKAYVRLPDGTMKTMQVGDKVVGGTRIVTEDDGLVEISPTYGPAVVLSDAMAPEVVDKAIAGLEAQDPEQVPAAGLDRGAEGSLRPGLRVDRVDESLGDGGVFRFAAPGAGDEGPFGSSADQRLLPVGLVGPNEPVDELPRVLSVRVVAADNNHVYYGIQLSNPDQLPVSLTLEVSPGSEAIATGDVWTGALAYSLDALDGLNEHITFISLNDQVAAGNGALGQASMLTTAQGNSMLLLDLPQQTPTGLILVKVPVYMQADANLPHIDAVKLSAATQYDDAPKTAEQPLLHGGISSGAPVMEGDYAVFDLTLARALDEDLKVSLTLHDGVDDPATPENERALLGMDTGTQLSYLSTSGAWVSLGADGVMVIEKGSLGTKIRVETIDDQIPEDMEHIRLSATGMLGDVVLPGVLIGHAAIRDNDDDFDPIRSERIMSGDEGVIALTLAPPLAGNGRAFDAGGMAVSGPEMIAALDARDLISDGGDQDANMALQSLLSRPAPPQSDMSAIEIGRPNGSVMADLGMFAAQFGDHASGHAKLLIETA